jgi:DNA-3-methyladenine glycosylase II
MSLVPWAHESHERLSRDKILSGLARLHGPPQVRLGTDPFATLVKCIAGQQLSERAAAAIFGKLENSLGTVSPERIEGAGLERLRSAGLSFAKAQTLLALSAAHEGLALNCLAEVPDESVKESLVRIKGIGPWTAEMFLLFGLGRSDVMSTGDLGLRKGLQVVYGLGSLPEPSECAAMFEPWRPYRSAASWYLWRAIEPNSQAQKKP